MDWGTFKKIVDKKVKDNKELEFIDVSFFVDEVKVAVSTGPTGIKIYNGEEDE